MKLFSEIYSCYYQVVAQILTEAAAQPVSGQQMNRIADALGYQESALAIVPNLLNGEWALMKELPDKPGFYESKLKHAPAAPLSALQRSWLKALLEDERICLFFTDEQLKMLRLWLRDVQPLFGVSDFLPFDCYSDGDAFSSVMYRQHFQTILRAIRKREALKCNYYSVKGKLLTHTCLPARLEYSAKEGKFRLYAFRYQKSGRWYLDILNLARILSIEETGYIAKAMPDIDRFLKQSLNREPLVLEISNERNALERTMLHFACYQKTVERLKDSETYRCCIYYDTMRETELLIQVLSFGPVVRVLGPEHFLELVRERVGKQRTFPDC